MNNAIAIFNSNMQHISKLDVLYGNIVKQVAADEVDDLLRWRWVQSVAALDKLVHDIVLAGILEFCRGVRNGVTKQLSEFPIPYAQAFGFTDMSEAERLSAISRIVIERHAVLSFQDPDKIAAALSFITPIEHKWGAIADIMKETDKTVRTTLKNVVVRRNQIVHQADYPAQSLARQVISKPDTDFTVSFVERVGQSIYLLVK